MTNPTFGDFVVRVGGLAAIFAAAILFAEAYYPGQEVTAVLIVSGAVFTLMGIQYYRRGAKRKRERR